MRSCSRGCWGPLRACGSGSNLRTLPNPISWPAWRPNGVSLRQELHVAAALHVR